MPAFPHWGRVSYLAALHFNTSDSGRKTIRASQINLVGSLFIKVAFERENRAVPTEFASRWPFRETRRRWTAGCNLDDVTMMDINFGPNGMKIRGATGFPL